MRPATEVDERTAPVRSGVADSLTLSLASAAVALVASSDWLSRTPWQTVTTIGFLLYFLWPMLCVAMLCLTGMCAVRDLSKGLVWQVCAAFVVSMAVLGLTFTRFRPWE